MVSFHVDCIQVHLYLNLFLQVFNVLNCQLQHFGCVYLLPGIQDQNVKLPIQENMHLLQLWLMWKIFSYLVHVWEKILQFPHSLTNPRSSHLKYDIDGQGLIQQSG